MDPYIKLKKLLPPVLCGIGILLMLKYVLPLTLPIVLGLSAAAALSPMIRRIQHKGSLRYSTAAGLCVSGLLFLLLILVTLLGRLLLKQLSRFYQSLPSIFSSLSRYAQSLSQWAQALAQDLPGGAGDALISWSEALLSSGGTLANSVYDGAFSLVSGFLTRLPDNLLFLITLLLSAYFGAAELPRLQAFLRERLPKTRWQQLSSLGGCIKSVLGGWIWAQIKLMGITFLILFTGFALLRVRFSLLLGLGIAALDALPIFGTGTILIPWGLLSMISGDFHLGVGLLLLYGAAALSRNVLEPKFLGAQMGGSSLSTLLAIYVGYRLSGVLGMILLPVLTMLGAEVLEARKRHIQT